MGPTKIFWDRWNSLLCRRILNIEGGFLIYRVRGGWYHIFFGWSTSVCRIVLKSGTQVIADHIRILVSLNYDQKFFNNFFYQIYMIMYLGQNIRFELYFVFHWFFKKIIHNLLKKSTKKTEISAKKNAWY